jgi:hypothetical protein
MTTTCCGYADSGSPWCTDCGSKLRIQTVTATDIRNQNRSEPPEANPYEYPSGICAGSYGGLDA